MDRVKSATAREEWDMIQYNGRSWNRQDFVVCMAWDSFRIALGRKPRNFSMREVMVWLQVVAKGGGDE